MKEPVLVVMAAGMGSRYGGLKQIDPVDQEGHIIMDFSIYDAVRAGFKKVIFIIKKENDILGGFSYVARTKGRTDQRKKQTMIDLEINQRLIAIEMTLDNQQKALDDLSEMVVKQGKIIDTLTAQNALLKSMLSQDIVKPQSEETPPPHY